ncbi:MAG: tetratricopeptide repeat protein, partial [Solimonas sp.]
LDATHAREIALDAPLARSLPKRKQAIDAALNNLLRAASGGDADITTAATYEIGAVYRDLGRALLDSARPATLKGDALEQYQILLEEQADPFEQKSIEAHASNLTRIRQGLWNDWIRRSAASLSELAPARYGKHELREDRYDALP